jgi:ketosteroid isomerase-like protein
MSQENVELVRRFHDHFDRTGEPLWDVLDSDIEVHDYDIPDAGTYQGLAGYSKWLTNWGEVFESFALELERIVDGGDQVVSLFLMRATGRGSGVSIERRDAMVSTIRNGKVTRVDYYNDQSQALEAVGLSKQDAHADS